MLNCSCVKISWLACSQAGDRRLLGPHPHIFHRVATTDTIEQCTAATMNITASFASQRGRALLTGDYNTYHAQTSRRIHKIRKNLKIQTPRGRKWTGRDTVTATQLAENIE